MIDRKGADSFAAKGNVGDVATCGKYYSEGGGRLILGGGMWLFAGFA